MEFQYEFNDLKNEINDHLNGLNIKLTELKLNELKLKLNENFDSLPNFDKKFYTSVLNDLIKQFNYIKDSISPRRKFKFNRKVDLFLKFYHSDEYDRRLDFNHNDNDDDNHNSLSNIHNDTLHLNSQFNTLDENIIIKDIDNSTITFDVSFNVYSCHVRDVNNSIILLPPLKGSVFLTNVFNSIIVVECHQVRLITHIRTFILTFDF